MFNILIVGNHCCSNRGDAAILRGLLDYLNYKLPNSNIDFTSRYIDGAKWMFKQDVLPDILHSEKQQVKGVKGRLRQLLVNKIILPLYCQHKITNKRFLPAEYSKFSNLISNYDLVIQVGGSFFVDLYGTAQYEAAVIANNDNIPFVMLGHSVGPFVKNGVASVAKAAFNHCQGIVLREKLSAQQLKSLTVAENKYCFGADTAWLIEPSNYTSNQPFINHSILERPYIAITARMLAPFDQRLKISQTDYEAKMASLASNLIKQGYNIIAVSTCTGLDSYHRDDRMVALRIGDLVGKPESYYTVMEELTDVELANLLAKAVLTIGTRLHSAILSMRFGTPAFAINYEHKSLGIMQQMQLADYAVDIHDIDSTSFMQNISSKLNNIDDEVDRVNQAVAIESTRCKEAIDSVLNPLLDNSYQ